MCSDVLFRVHFVTVYTRVSPKLSQWLRTKNVSDDDWIAWLLRDSTLDLAAVADELQEAATAGEALMSPILSVERYAFDDSERLELFIERRQLHLTSRPKHYATSALIAKFISKWFEILEKEDASDPYRDSQIS